MALSGGHVAGSGDHVGDHNLIDAALALASGLPTGGAAGNVLAKLSSANGDAGWAAALSASSTQTISGAWDFTTAPTVNGSAIGGGGSGIVDAYAVMTPLVPASGTTYTVGGGSGTAGASMFNRGLGYPFRINASATYKLGVNVTTAGSVGAVIRLAAYADAATGDKPGALIADLGTLDASATGLRFTATGVALASGVRYWVLVIAQGGAATSPSVTSMPISTGFSLGMDGTGTGPASSFRYTDAGALSSNPTIIANDTISPHRVYFQAV